MLLFKKFRSHPLPHNVRAAVLASPALPHLVMTFIGVPLPRDSTSGPCTALALAVPAALSPAIRKASSKASEWE